MLSCHEPSNHFIAVHPPQNSTRMGICGVSWFLLATRASPWHVHLGALLIGLAAPEEDAPPQDVGIVVEWETNGPRRSHRLEELIALAKESPWGPVGGTLAAGAWSYRGSIVDSLGLAAARVVALDSSAPGAAAGLQAGDYIYGAFGRRQRGG